MKFKAYLKLKAVLVFCFVLISAVPSYAESIVESYCQVAIETAQQELDYLNELSTLTQVYCEDPNFLQEYCNDPNSFLERKLILQQQFDSNEAALFEDFNSTAEEYDTFMSANATAVEEYLNNDPNMKQAIDNLSCQINNLLKALEVPSYCLLTIATARQEIDNLNELIALAQYYSNDRDLFLEQEQMKRQEFDDDKQALFESFDMTAHEYLVFMSKNTKAVEQYLANHTIIRDTINNLSNQVATLLEEYEALRESIIKISAEEPPR